MYTQIINKLGLSRVQSEILNSLLSTGPDKASNIAKKIKRPRGVTYKGLEELIALKLVLKADDKKKVSIYSAEHPSYLESVIEQKERRIKKERQEFINNLPDLISAYNLVSNKPGVRFYEGEGGVKKVLDETLNTKGEVLTYLDIEIVEKHFKEINDKYVKERERKNISKRLLVIENDFSKKLFKKWSEKNPNFFKITDLKMVKTPISKVEGTIQIYDNKIGLITVSNDNLVSIIIEDARINKLFKSIFEALYSTSSPFKP